MRISRIQHVFSHDRSTPPLNTPRIISRYRFRGLWAINEFFAAVVSVTCCLAAILTYAYLARPEDITAGTVFTAISLFNLLRQPLQFIPLMISAGLKGLVSVERIERYLRDGNNVDTPRTPEKEDKMPAAAVHLQSASCSWGGQQACREGNPGEGGARAIKSKQIVDSGGEGVAGEGGMMGQGGVVLRDLDLRVDWVKAAGAAGAAGAVGAVGAVGTAGAPGAVDAVDGGPATEGGEKRTGMNSGAPLVAVVGPVASGKSTLLSLLLGEAACVGGSVRAARHAPGNEGVGGGGDGGGGGGDGDDWRGEAAGSVSYVPQTAWVMNATLRDKYDYQWCIASSSSPPLQTLHDASISLPIPHDVRSHTHTHHTHLKCLAPHAFTHSLLLSSLRSLLRSAQHTLW